MKMEILNNCINNTQVKVINTNKFKTVNIEIFFTKELDYKDIAPYNLLVNILISRNAKYPSISSFATYKEDNYGLSVNGGYTSRGNIGVVNFRVSAINSKFALSEDLLHTQIDTIKECLYNPILDKKTLNEVKDIYVSRL